MKYQKLLQIGAVCFEVETGLWYLLIDNANGTWAVVNMSNESDINGYVRKLSVSQQCNFQAFHWIYPKNDSKNEPTAIISNKDYTGVSCANEEMMNNDVVAYNEDSDNRAWTVYDINSHDDMKLRLYPGVFITIRIVKN